MQSGGKPYLRSTDLGTFYFGNPRLMPVNIGFHAKDFRYYGHGGDQSPTNPIAYSHCIYWPFLRLPFALSRNFLLPT
jgi:hypothetical protein